MRWSSARQAAYVAALAACGRSEPSRAETVVVVDTDARVAGELLKNTTVSADATVDELRVDALDASLRVYDEQSFVVSSTSTWPLSFGVIPPPSGGGSVILRLRLFRALFASRSTELGHATLEPRPEVTIDRLVQFDAAGAGVRTVAVTLREDCMGTPVSFGTPPTTCVDATRLHAPPTEGVAGAAAPTSLVGTWAPARSTPCSTPPASGQVCIEGSFLIVGDLGAVGLSVLPLIGAPVPLRPAVVSPFWLDQAEFTVRHLRALLKDGGLAGVAEPVVRGDPSVGNSFACTWLGVDGSTNDDLPVNCVELATATAACAALGRRLPTEVEWEFAARGRGSGFTFPWGGAYPNCCTASLSRGPGALSECGDGGVEPVRSHPRTRSCDPGDESPDHVYDLGGSVSEALSTGFAPYSADCWASVGILRGAPHCRSALSSIRGGNWNAGFVFAVSALRNNFVVDPTIGFRCARDGTSP